MKISANRWNIIQRIIREYPDTKKELEATDQEGPYRDRLEREVEAVEEAYALLTPEEQKVIEERFWTTSDKNKSYEKIWDTGYSPRQMRRIAKKMTVLTGQKLGEIRPTDIAQDKRP